MKMEKLKGSSDNVFKEKVMASILKYSMLKRGEVVLIGLSGGPDSVCLTFFLNSIREEYGLNLYAVYINHNLRPSEVPGETEFCSSLCRRLGIGFMVKDVDVISLMKIHRMNRQEAARELRYRALEEARSEIKADKIALGHNADDQAETFIMRALRGAGPKGLSGIPPVRGNVIRPLIEIERKDIEEFLESENIRFMTDSSNLKPDYFRSKLRRSLMPALKGLSPTFISALLNTMTIMREEEAFFDIAVTKSLMKLISRKKHGRIELFLSPLESLEKVLLRRVLRRAIDDTSDLKGIGFIHIEDIMNLIKSGKSGDRIYLPKGIRVIREYSLLVITSETPAKLSQYLLYPPSECSVREAGLVLRASTAENGCDFGNGKSSVVLDAGEMQFPLIIRSRRPGDFFFPLGFGRRKKLQDFFVDEKIPRDERDSVPLVISREHIIWVAGYRADERFRISARTEKFLRLDLFKGNF